MFNRKMFNRKIYIVILIASIFMIFGMNFGISIVSGTENLSNQSSTEYRSFVDTHGFYKVANTSSNKLEPYDNNTFKIHKGDVVTWINDEPTEKRFTIVSGQNLWKNESGFLGAMDKQFSYMFDKTGTYTVYIKEFPKLRRQKIMVISSIMVTNKTKTIKTKTAKTNTTSEPKKKKSDGDTIKIPISKNKSDNNLTLILLAILLLSVSLFVYKKYDKGKKVEETKTEENIGEVKTEENIREVKTDEKVEDIKTDEKVEEIKTDEKVEEIKTEDTK